MKCRGLPYSTSETEVAEFFEDYDVSCATRSHTSDTWPFLVSLTRPSFTKYSQTRKTVVPNCILMNISSVLSRAVATRFEEVQLDNSSPT